MSRFLLALLTLAPLSAYQGPSPTAAEVSRLIREAGLDPAECYRVRDFSFAKDDVRLYLNDGYLIFSKPVLGQRLSAVFTTEVEGGDGEVIVIPPTRSERQSLASFTQSPNLDEHFRAALLMFTDGSGARLRESLQGEREPGEAAAQKSPEMGAVLAQQWTPVVSNVSLPMQMRLVGDLLASRPAETGFTLLAVGGKTLGAFDIIMDARAGRRVVVRQRSESAGKGAERDTYNVWTDFVPRAVARAVLSGKPIPAARDFTLSRYRIQAEIGPVPGGGLGVKAVTHVTVRVGANPMRAFPFEIARAMQIGAVRIDGVAAEVLRDDSHRGSLVLNTQDGEFLTVAPAPLEAGTEHEFEFEHQGDVIATRGDGVYFVNARGTWYPHLASSFATYDLTFRYPKRLTLVAAGDPAEDRVDGDWRITQRRIAVPIGSAGFNLGVYEKVTGTAAGVSFEVYGNRYLEDALRPKVVFLPPPVVTTPAPRRSRDGLRLLEPTPPQIVDPDPRGRLRAVAEDLSASLQFFSGLFGPPLMKTLTVAPIPGTFGQGFPGLVYLSTFAYIEPSERPAALRNAREQSFFSDLMVPHEAAHQWWGSIVAAGNPKDEWLMEALASYSSLLWLEKKKGVKEMEKVLNGYRDELLSKDETGALYESAGPIVWGDRLSPSSTIGSWRVITYNKGTWILHMLRRRMGDEAFLKMLAELRKRYEFQTITTENFRALVRELRPKSVSADAIDAFFDNWVYATGVPSLKLQYAVKGVAPSVNLSGTITQSGVDDDFSTDTPVEVQFGKSAPQIIWVRTAGESGAFTANLRQMPTRVAIPNDVLMKK